MRYLEFRDGDGLRFTLLYTGILDSKRGFSDTETRVIGNVLTKLEAIGRPVDDGNGATFALLGSAVVSLEDAEYKLTVDSVKQVRWTARFSRPVADMLDWLREAPTKKPGDMPLAK